MLQGLHHTTSTPMTSANCLFSHHNCVATAEPRDVYSSFAPFAKWRRLTVKPLVTVNSTHVMKDKRNFKMYFLSSIK